jgi:hypothetical protein
MLRASTRRLGTPVYELRTYDLKPERVSDYGTLTKNLFHLRTKHSKLCGFWVTELGGVNQVVHVWEYESLAHRKSVREALAVDTQWMTDYITPARPMWSLQNNQLLTPLQTPLSSSSGSHVYTMHFAEKPLEAPRDSEVVGHWRVAIGSRVGLVVSLLRSKNADALISPEWFNTNAALLSNTEGKLLIPAAFLSNTDMPWK